MKGLNQQQQLERLLMKPAPRGGPVKRELPVANEREKKKAAERDWDEVQ